MTVLLDGLVKSHRFGGGNVPRTGSYSFASLKEILPQGYQQSKDDKCHKILALEFCGI